MKRLTLPLIAAMAALGSTAALAQSPAGSPADPNSTQNRQPGPSAGQPSDPAAGQNPAARSPTAPSGTGSDYGSGTGAGTGESGSSSTTTGPMPSGPPSATDPAGPGSREQKPTMPPRGFQQQ